MMAALFSLKPVQRFRRVRRLLAEVRGQRVLLSDKGVEERIRRSAEERLARAMIDLVDELNTLDEAGVLDAVAECFATIFGGDAPPVRTE